MNVVMRPNNPSFDTWHYFIECDDALHRIYRLSSQLGEGVGVSFKYVSSFHRTCFILSSLFNCLLNIAINSYTPHRNGLSFRKALPNI